MKRTKGLLLSLLVLTLAGTTACQRRNDEIWEDTRTAGRYVGRGLRSIGGKSGDSRQISDRDDFGVATNYHDAFIPLQEEEGHALSLNEREAIPHARNTPGDPGSSIPGIDRFVDPKDTPDLAHLFRNINFPYNSELIKGNNNLQIAQAISDHLKKHPNTYIFVEGHCDERGPQAYNLALGIRRSNSVRKFLVNQGVSPDNIFTISYGKERPLQIGNSEESWSVNRRAQFKVYSR